MQMSNEAKNHYNFITNLSYDYGLINIFTYQERMDFLYDNYRDEEQRNENDDEPFFEKYSSEESNSSKGEPLLSFLTTQIGVLKSKWKFTIGDPDPFPSIPHGHLYFNTKIKLDCYLGYTFDTQNGNKHLSREKRKFIIKLWNDIKFRDFALNHIDWFIYNNPKYNWRVKHKCRLPRMRH